MTIFSSTLHVAVLRPLLIMLVLLPVQSAVICAQDVKAVFVRGGDIGIANGDGSSSHMLTHGAGASNEAHWSSDGRSILYTVPSKKDNVLADLIVVSASDGKETAHIPIYQMAPDGETILNNMRFVERSGWLGTSTAFVFGSENPYEPSLELFNVNKKASPTTYNPDAFAACRASDKLALAYTPNGQSDIEVFINDRRVYTGNSDDIIYGMAWNADCTQLAFFRDVHGDEKNSEFMLLNGSSLIHVPRPDDLQASQLIAVDRTFVAERPDGEDWEYIPETRSFHQPSGSVQDKLALQRSIVARFRSSSNFVELYPDILTANIRPANANSGR